MKRTISVLLALAMLLSVFPTSVLAAEESDRTLRKDGNEENIYYTDLFYKYPYYLTNSEYFSTYNNDTEFLFDKVYDEYIHSPYLVGTGIENAMSLFGSVTDITRFLASALGLSDYTANQALDSANNKLMLELISGTDNDLLKAYGSIGKATKKVQSAFRILDTYYGYDPSELTSDVDSIQYQTQILLRDVYVELWNQGLIKKLDNNVISQLYSSLAADGIKIADYFDQGIKVIDIARSMLQFIIIEDTKMELIDEVLASLTTRSVLKDGLTRLKSQLSGGFVTYFINTYVKTYALNAICGFIDEFVQGIIPGYKLIAKSMSAVKAVVFSFWEVPKFDDIMTYKVLEAYSYDMRSVLQSRAELFSSNPTYSEDISLFESLFSTYVAVNNIAIGSLEKIADTMDPFADIYAFFVDAQANDEIDKIVITWKETDTNEDQSQEFSPDTEKEAIAQFFRLLFAAGKRMNEFVVRQISVKDGQPNPLKTVKFITKYIIYSVCISDEIGELKIPILNYKDQYDSKQFYSRYIQGVKEQILNIPVSERITVPRDTYLGWTYQIVNGRRIEYQTDETESNTVYMYEGRILGNVLIQNADIINTVIVEGDALLKGTINIAADFNVCGNLSIAQNAESSLVSIKTGNTLTVDGNASIASLFILETGNHSCTTRIEKEAALHVGGNVSTSGASYGNAGYHFMNLDNQGELIVAGDFVGGSVTKYYQNSADSYSRIDGTFSMNSFSGSLTAGILEIRGDSSAPFVASGTHKTIISGNTAQSVSGFSAKNLTITNTSTDGVTFSGACTVTGELSSTEVPIKNGENLQLNNGSVADGTFNGSITLKGTINIANDWHVCGNLNIAQNIESKVITVKSGHTLTVDGNVSFASLFLLSSGDHVCTTRIEEGATLYVGGNASTTGSSYGNVGYHFMSIDIKGELIVAGDFDGGSVTKYYQNTANSFWRVDGTFSMNSFNGSLTSGILEIRGDSSAAFVASGTHKTIISGNTAQSVSGFSAKDLSITNTSNEGVTFSGTCTVTGELSSTDVPIKNGENLLVNNGSVAGGMFNGSITLRGTINIANDWHICENLIISQKIESSVVTVKSGRTLFVDGNASLSSLFIMSSGNRSCTTRIEKGATLCVGGTVSTSGSSYGNVGYHAMKLVNEGNFYLYGDLKINSNSTFSTSGVFFLCGNNNQAVTGATSFSTIIIDKGSDDGIVSFANKITVSVLFDHRQNAFSLYNNGSGSTFVDYDGDGLKDNVDPYPTVGNPCTILIQSANLEHGSVSEESISTIGGTTVTVSASPTFKYTFDKWIDESGAIMSGSAQYTFVAKTDTVLTAVFTKRKQPITITSEGGYIIAPASAEIESIVQVSVTEDEGYIYEEGSLSCNGIQVADGAFEMPDEPVTLTAAFLRNESYFALKDVLDTARAISYIAYSPESFSALQEAIAAADAALNNHISEAESDAHIQSLQQAMDALQSRTAMTITAAEIPTFYVGVADSIASIVIVTTYDNGVEEVVNGWTVSGFDDTMLGEQEITVSWNELETTFLVTVLKRRMSDVMISAIPNQVYKADGTEFTPSPSLTYSITGETLTIGTDYEVSYSNNIEIGTATVVISGVGIYDGIQTTTFRIYCEHAPCVLPEVLPTCTSSGLTEGSYCGICGATLVSQTVLDALGHNYVDGLCQNCGDQLERYDIEYRVPEGVESPASVSIWENESIVLPVLNAPEGYEFVGWAEEKVALTTVIPEMKFGGEEIVPEESKTFYAVFLYIDRTMETGTGNYYKVVEEPGTWDGDYLIVCDDAEYILDGSATISGNLPSVHTTIHYAENDLDRKWIFATDGDPYYFSIASVPENGEGTNLYTLQGSSGYYLSISSTLSLLLGSYPIMADYSTAMQKPFMISLTGGIVSALDSSRTMRFLLTTNRFRFFSKASTNTNYTDVSLYKKDGGFGTKYYTSELDICSTLEHFWDEGIITIPPTETETGLRTYTCVRCGQSWTETISAVVHEHTYTSETIPPSCTQSGCTTHTCTSCGDTYTDAQLPPLGHDWSPWTVTTEATCTEQGEELRTCSRCDAAESREVVALGHDMDDHEAKAPTCTESGWDTYQTCSRCDYTTYEEIPALGHTWNIGMVTQLPTETATGVKTFTCTRCGQTRTEDIPVATHSYLPLVYTTDKSIYDADSDMTAVPVISYLYMGPGNLAFVHDGFFMMQPGQVDVSVGVYYYYDSVSDDFVPCDPQLIIESVYDVPVTGGYMYYSPKTGAIVACDDTVTIVSVSQFVEDMPVTGIGKSAFGGCSSLTEITILNPECVISAYSDTLGDPEKTTVYGYSGSTAEAYAEQFGYSFVVLEPVGYRVQFDANGGEGEMAKQAIDFDVYVDLTANAFMRTGYSFNGWNTEADGSGTAYADGARVRNLTSGTEITLYAQWKAKTYIVRYYANGGEGAALENQRATYDVPFALQENSFTRTGYTAAGWNTAADGSGTAYESGQLTSNLTDAAAITLYAQFAPNTYAIVFNANGGEGEMADQQMTYGSYSALTQNAFARTGYTFDGWNTAKDGTGTVYPDKRTVRNLATEGTVTLYAQWTRNTYTILFAANGGTGTATSQKATYNLPIALTANAFTRTGYTFNGWNTESDGSGTQFTDRQTVLNLASAGTVKLYAQWKPKTYTIMFVTNGGTGSTVSQKTSYDLPTELTLNTFTRTGYSFYRWNTAADGTGSYYTDGQTVKNLAVSGTFKLYAQWKPNKYTVTFNANGGTGTMVDQSMTYNTSAALRANTYTKTGYTFTSWNTAPDGSGTSYTNGKTVRNLATEGTVTLYAQWKANTITVRFYPNGGTGSMSNQVMTYDVPAALSANAFYRDGYTFAGWKTGSGVIYTDGQVVENLALKGVVNLYAQWTR